MTASVVTLLFAVASIGCMTAPDFEVMLGWRAIQGFAGAGLVVWWRAGIYVLNLGMGQTGAIFVFSSSATGATSPLATISGPATGLLAPQGLAVDSAGNIYVGSFDSTKLVGSILVFAPGSTGNVTPVRIISGPNTLLGPIQDLRLDQAGTLYVNSARPGRVSFGAHILTFASGASGDVAPVSDLAAETSSVNHVPESFSKLAVF